MGNRIIFHDTKNKILWVKIGKTTRCFTEDEWTKYTNLVAVDDGSKKGHKHFIPGGYFEEPLGDVTPDK